MPRVNYTSFLSSNHIETIANNNIDIAPLSITNFNFLCIKTVWKRKSKTFITCIENEWMWKKGRKKGKVDFISEWIAIFIFLLATNEKCSTFDIYAEYSLKKIENEIDFGPNFHLPSYTVYIDILFHFNCIISMNVLSLNMLDRGHKRREKTIFFIVFWWFQ